MHVVCRYLSRDVLTDVVTQCFVMFRNEGIIIISLPYFGFQSEVKVLLVFSRSLLDGRTQSGAGDSHLCPCVLGWSPGEH